MKRISSVLLFVCFVICSNAQTNIFPSTGSAGIGTITPNVSSILEMKSTTKGMLVPRMTKTQRDAIATPVTGLLVFQTNSTPGFYYYSGATWTAVSSIGANTSLSNLSAPTKVNVNLLSDSSNFRSLGSITRTWKNFYFDGAVYSQGHKFISNDGANLTCVFMGDMAGNANATYGNAGFGAQALLNNTTGFGNSGLGSQPLYSNTTGSENTATGYLTLFTNTTGSQNAASGAYALELNTTGSHNSAFGANALLNNSTSNYNTASGFNALANSNAAGNTAVGAFALDSNTTGTQNVAIGYDAGYYTSTGSNNTFVGAGAGFTNNYLNNTTCLGYGSGNYFGTDNVVRIGNSSIIQIGGQVGWSQFSDGRMKDNVKQDVPGLSFINKLNPVTYSFNIHRENEMLMKGRKDSANWKGKYDIEKKKMSGFIAQEVEKAANDLGYDFSGVVKPVTPDGLYALTYSDFVVPLVKAVQELSEISDDQKSIISDLKNENNLLEQRIAKLEAMMNVQSAVVNNAQQGIALSGAALEQNTPNPFVSTTVIHYTLSQKFSSAQIIITDESGKVLKHVNLTSAGKGSVNVDAAMLSSGTYNYSLYADGKLIGSKQMVLAK